MVQSINLKGKKPNCTWNYPWNYNWTRMMVCSWQVRPYLSDVNIRVEFPRGTRLVRSLGHKLLILGLCTTAERNQINYVKIFLWWKNIPKPSLYWRFIHVCSFGTEGWWKYMYMLYHVGTNSCNFLFSVNKLHDKEKRFRLVVNVSPYITLLRAMCIYRCINTCTYMRSTEVTAMRHCWSTWQQHSGKVFCL
jgi:hypothetical protein